MKRITNILTIFVAVFIFMFFYQSISVEHYNSVNSLISSFADSTGKEHASISYNFYDEEGNETLQELVDFLEEHNYDAITGIQTRRYDFIIDSSVYLHTGEKLNSLNHFKTINGINIDFSIDNNAYYSSFIGEEDATDIIDFINNSYHREYQPRITIKQFRTYLEDNPEIRNGFVNLYGENTNRILLDVENSQIANYVTSYNPLTFMESLESDIENIEAINILLILSISSLIVISVCDLIKEKREITIRKLFGESNSSIYYDLIFKRYLINILLFIVSQVILYTVIVRGIRLIHLLLLRPLLFAFTLYMVFWILANIISYFVLTRVGRAINLKQSSTVRFTNSITLLIKLLLLVLMITPFIDLFTTAPLAIEENIVLRKNEDKMLGNLTIAGYMGGGDGDLPSGEKSPGEEALELTLDFIEDLNWIYHYFYYLPEDILEEIPEEVVLEQFIHHPYIVANQAYLKDYDIKDLEGNHVDPNSLEHNTLLVPETYKGEEFTDVYYDSFTHNTLYIQDGGTFYNYYPSWDIDRMRKDNPLILYKNHWDDEGMSWNADSLSIGREKDTHEIINNFLADNDFENYVFIENGDSFYKALMSRSNEQVFNFTLTLLLYILMVFIFQYQTIFVYFSENKDRIAVNYLFGKSYIQRYGLLTFNSILIYIVPLAIGIGYLQIQFKYMLLYILFGIVIDTIVSTIMIRSFEKKRTLSVLKGE